VRRGAARPVPAGNDDRLGRAVGVVGGGRRGPGAQARDQEVIMYIGGGVILLIIIIIVIFLLLRRR